MMGELQPHIVVHLARPVDEAFADPACGKWNREDWATFVEADVNCPACIALMTGEQKVDNQNLGRLEMDTKMFSLDVTGAEMGAVHRALWDQVVVLEGKARFAHATELERATYRAEAELIRTVVARNFDLPH